MTRDFYPSITHSYFLIRRYLYKAIRKQAPALHGRLMDFGCGSQPYREFFNVEEYIGVDFKHEGNLYHNKKVDVFYDGKNLPFTDAYFDSVLCSEVFEHVFNLDDILKEINRVMKAGGKMLLTCPFVWNEHESPYDFARYTRFALKDILERNGFEVIEYQKTGNFVTALTQLWILYFHTILYEKTRRFAPLRWLFKVFFVVLPNCIGLGLNKLLPAESSLYLNNIVLARKKEINVSRS